MDPQPTQNPNPVTYVENGAVEAYHRLREQISKTLKTGSVPAAANVDYSVPVMSVQEMFGIEPGSMVFVSKIRTEGAPPPALNGSAVERSRTVEIKASLIDARLHNGDILLSLHCYEHVFRGLHNIELTAARHKYFEWILETSKPNQHHKCQEVVALCHRYLCTGLVGDLPPTCKYPPPHIPEVY